MHMGATRVTDTVSPERAAAVARWEARNAAVRVLAEAAANFRWPAAILDEAPSPSRTRNMLTEIRQTYQRATQTRLAAYRAYRDQGNETRAQAQLDAMLATSTGLARTVRRLRNVFDATFIENLAQGIDETTSHAAELMRAVASGAVALGQGVTSNLGLVLALAAVAAFVYFGRK